MNKPIVGAGINVTYRRTPYEWMDLIIKCITELQNIINDMDEVNKENKEYIKRNISHIKRFYEEMEKEFFRCHLEEQEQQKSTDTVKSNISIHF
jgi:hypothetical protein